MQLVRRLTPRVKLLLISALLGCALIQVSYLRSASVAWENPPQMVGVRDYIAYWAGFQVFRNGGNPYRKKEVFSYQEQLMSAWEVPQDEPQVFLNPPWAFVLLAPVLFLPFEVGRILWLVLNTGFALCIGWVLLGYFNRSTKSRREDGLGVLLGSFAFLPSLMCIWVGQLSLLVTLFLVLTFVAIARERDFFAGLCLIPVSLKPHTAFLVILLLGIWILRERRWKIVGGALLVF